ncbi:MAG: outer membrane protein assembly factor BamE [Planctomycetota bacterium]
MRFSIRALLLLMAVVASVIASAIHSLGPVVPHSDVARIVVGDTQQHVRDVLGDPSSNSLNSCWYYDRPMNPGWLTVGFDSLGHVSYVDHEHAFP